MNKREGKWTQIAKTIIIGPDLTDPIRTILKDEGEETFIDFKGELCGNTSPLAPTVVNPQNVLLHEEWNDIWNGVTLDGTPQEP